MLRGENGEFLLSAWKDLASPTGFEPVLSP
jgi:hypothetical protein